jgi:hypothetical protein
MTAAVANDAWSFGWTQLLTIVGLVLTAIVSGFGLRTFGKWRRENIEDRRIETAVDALSLAYQAKWVFQNIRAPITYSYEYESMPGRSGESEDIRAVRGKYFAVLRRVERNSEFFRSIWNIQPRMMALFGPDVEAIFLELHEARRQMEVSAELLLSNFVRERGLTLTDENKKLKERQIEDIDWAEASAAEGGDRIGAKLLAFRAGMEKLCRPIVEKGYRD